MASSSIESSDVSDVRSTVVDILDDLVVKNRSRTYNKDLLALEAIRSI